MALVGVVFRYLLGHEGRALINEVSALIKDHTELLRPFHHMRIQQNGTTYEPEREPSLEQNHVVP